MMQEDYKVGARICLLRGNLADTVKSVTKYYTTHGGQKVTISLEIEDWSTAWFYDSPFFSITSLYHTALPFGVRSNVS